MLYHVQSLTGLAYEFEKGTFSIVKRIMTGISANINIAKSTTDDSIVAILNLLKKVK